jgi:alpha-galactosidase
MPHQLAGAAEISHDPQRRLWVVSGPTTSYVLHLDGEDRLRGAYWGPRLEADQAAELPRFGDRVWHRPFEGPDESTLDTAPATAGVYGHAAVQLRFADGTRDLEPVFTGYRVEPGENGTELVLGFADRHYPVVLEHRLTVHDDTDVIERRLVLRHTGEEGDAPLTVVRADSAGWVLPRRDGYRLTQVRGRWGAETRLARTELPYGETVLSSRRGTTGHHANPWAMVDDGTAGEEHGEVWGCALAWSGSWRLTAQRLPDERVTLAAGFGHDPVTWPLRPGQALETPVCAGLYSPAGFGAAARAWHAYQLAHVLPHSEELRPVLYNSWEATGFDVSLDGQLRLAEKAAALGVELFTMDDGWFGARTHDAAGLGDWRPNPERFPDGLGPLIKRVHELGMLFGLWVEPEMVNPDSDLYRAHPDWVLHQPHRRRTEHRNQLVLNLARPDVRDWLHGTLDTLVRENEIDFLKWDMNRPFTEAGWPAAGEDADLLWRDYVLHLYEVIDRLRADHPRLRIESCSSGGGRVDLGILTRTDQVWTSDNTDAVDRLTIQDGYAQLYPARAMAAWVTDSPNPITGRRTPLDFRFHVAMAGVLGIGGDLLHWTEAELARAAELVADYKAVRPVVQRGHRYRLRPAEESFSAVQFVAEDGTETAVFGYRLSARYGPDTPPVRLRGLARDARYREAGTGREHWGAVLMGHGLELELGPDDLASTLVRLVRVE